MTARGLVHIHPSDTVAVAVEHLAGGTMVNLKNTVIVSLQDIPRGHKIAIRDLKKGEDVVKYGHVIGHMTEDAPAGSWVHAHNLATNLNEKAAYAYAPVDNKPQRLMQGGGTFLGYRRAGGSVATRNEIWIINTVGCVNASAERIARIAGERYRHENVDGFFSFSHPYGCSQLGDDLVNTRQVLAGLMRNPNAGGVLVLGLGCENNQMQELLALAGAGSNPRVRTLVSQMVVDEVEEGVRLAGELYEAARDDRREPCSAADLVIGMKCGGSDAFSGITANPLTGRITDRVTGMGGRVLLTEVPEMFGAEHQLMNRAKSEEVFHDIVRMITSFKQYFADHGQPVYENPSPGNKEGGITTLEEKSLGAIQKGGTAIVSEVLAYGRPVTERGLALVNAPGNDGVSSTAMVASGATLLLFTTGRGTPLGFPVPTVKIASSSFLARGKPSWIDFNAGEILEGSISIEDLGRDFFSYILDVASGTIRTKNELNGYREIAIWKEGVTL